MIRGLFATGLFSPVLKGLFDTSVLTRYFTTFDSVAQTRIDLSSPITLAGDFEIEVEFSLSDLTGDFCFTSDYGAGADDFFRIDATNGSFDLKVGGTFYSDDAAFTADNKLHTVLLRRIGTTLTRVYDGVEIGSAPVNISNFTVAAIGARDTFPNYFDGIIANLKIWDAGTLVLDMPIDGQYGTDSTVINNVGANGTAVNFVDTDSELYTFDAEYGWLGEERVVNGGFDTDTDWTKGTGWTIENGKANFAGSDSNISQFNIIDIGKSYVVTFDVSNVASGQLAFRNPSNVSAFAVASEGSYTYAFTAESDHTIFRSETSFSGSLDNVSVKRILEIPA
jgi:hypothetical protein